MNALAWFGKMAKAEVRDGKPFLKYLVTGPELDKQVERVAKTVADKVVALAKAGKIFLAPSHDTPLQLAKSTDAEVDEAGHTYVELGVDEEDPLAMKVFRGYESGDWAPTVSLGAEKVTRTKIFDAALGKTVTEIVDLDENKPVHIALAFPGREAYPLAGITQAIRKALSADAAELKKRLWPEEAIQKALGAADGWPPPPTFGDRWKAKEVQDDLPDMMDILRWTIEDTVSPYTAGTTEEKRALVLKSVVEFLDVVLGEIAAAEGAGKAEGTPADGLGKADPPAPAAAPQQEPPATAPPAAPKEEGTPEGTEPPATNPPEEGGAPTKIESAVKALTETVSGLTGTLSEVKGKIEALQGMLQKAESPAPPEPEGPTTDPATAPHTGVGLEEPTPGADPEAKKALEDEEAALRKAISESKDASRKAMLISQHGAVIAKLQRLEQGA